MTFSGNSFYFGHGTGAGIPRANLIAQIKTPNSDNVFDDETTETDESLLDIGYAPPLSAFATLGVGPWFTDENTPLTLLMSAILLDSETNIDGGYVFASAAKGVAFYSVGQTGTALARLSRYFKFEINPAALSGWVDESGSLWADQAGDNWNA